VKVGKLPAELLERFVMSRIGVIDPEVLVGPKYGEDAAIIKIGGSYIAAHSDPITAAVKNAGWLAINVASNDVAVRGAMPRWVLNTILLPPSASIEDLDEITGQIDRAARRLGIMIVGGHTEVTDVVSRLVIVSTVIGPVVGRPISTGGAGVGDMVIMTKTAGVEGTAIIATDYRDILLRKGVPQEVLDRALSFYDMISVVDEALALAKSDLATSMHDPTEGGIVGGVAEIAYASGKGVEIWEESVPIAPETQEIAQTIGIDPLRLISSGSLIATIPRDHVEEAIKILRMKGIKASIIGKVLPSGSGVTLVKKDSTRIKIPMHVDDEIYRVSEIIKTI
jgi:hydrogenase expression/formation protein HypE